MIPVTRELLIREALESHLSSVTDRIFYESAPKKTEYPYAVYVLGDSIDESSLENMELELTVWDRPFNGSTVALARLTGELDERLHRSMHRNQGVFFSVYRDRRTPSRDNDERLKQRQILYRLRVMGVGM